MITPALLEAARVLYEADPPTYAVPDGNGGLRSAPFPWDQTDADVKFTYAMRAAALLRWEHGREPSEGMLKAADDSDREYTDRTFGRGSVRFSQGGYDHYVVMTTARLRELGI